MAENSMGSFPLFFFHLSGIGALVPTGGLGAIGGAPHGPQERVALDGGAQLPALRGQREGLLLGAGPGRTGRVKAGAMAKQP